MHFLQTTKLARTKLILFLFFLTETLFLFSFSFCAFLKFFRPFTIFWLEILLNFKVMLGPKRFPPPPDLTVLSWVFMPTLCWIQSMSYTVRKYNWWCYCLALSDHFSLFEETLRQIEICKSVNRQIQRNPPTLFFRSVYRGLIVIVYSAWFTGPYRYIKYFFMQTQHISAYLCTLLEYKFK